MRTDPPSSGLDKVLTPKFLEAPVRRSWETARDHPDLSMVSGKSVGCSWLWQVVAW
jgi:hypothetical protein